MKINGVPLPEVIMQQEGMGVKDRNLYYKLLDFPFILPDEIAEEVLPLLAKGYDKPATYPCYIKIYSAPGIELFELREERDSFFFRGLRTGASGQIIAGLVYRIRAVLDATSRQAKCGDLSQDKLLEVMDLVYNLTDEVREQNKLHHQESYRFAVQAVEDMQRRVANR